MKFSRHVENYVENFKVCWKKVENFKVCGKPCWKFQSVLKIMVKIPRHVENHVENFKACWKLCWKFQGRLKKCWKSKVCWKCVENFIMVRYEKSTVTFWIFSPNLHNFLIWYICVWRIISAVDYNFCPDNNLVRIGVSICWISFSQVIWPFFPKFKFFWEWKWVYNLSVGFRMKILFQVYSGKRV